MILCWWIPRLYSFFGTVRARPGASVRYPAVSVCHPATSGFVRPMFCSSGFVRVRPGQSVCIPCRFRLSPGLSGTVRMHSVPTPGQSVFNPGLCRLSPGVSGCVRVISVLTPAGRSSLAKICKFWKNGQDQPGL